MNPEIAAYVYSHVFKHSRHVLLVSRAGGDWQCLCGESHEEGEIPYVVGLNHLIKRDPTLKELRDLPINWEAERVTVSDPWIRTRMTAEE
jgi:hypothetical protein